MAEKTFKKEAAEIFKKEFSDPDNTAIAVIGAAVIVGLGVYFLRKNTSENGGGGGGTGKASITGTVKNNYTNQPISGAKITIGSRYTYTNSSGKYSISDLDPGTYDASAEATSYDNILTSITVEEDEAYTLDFAMIARVTLQGAVTDSVTNAAISGASVNVGGTILTTSANGNYSVVLPEGNYSVQVSKTGYITQTHQKTVTLPLAILNISLVQEFAQTGVVQGRITNASSGNGISGARIQLGSQYTNSNSQGYYSIEVPVGTYTITVSASGYNTATRNFTVRVGTINTENFALTPVAVPPGAITGRVKNASTGADVSGATVWLNETQTGGAMGQTITNSLGSYLFSNIAPGNYTITVEKDGYSDQNKTTTVTSGNTSTVNFNLVPSAVQLGFVMSVEFDPTNYPTATTWYADLGGRIQAWWLDTFDLWDRRGTDLASFSFPLNLTIELYNSSYTRLVKKVRSVTMQNGHSYSFYVESNTLIDNGMY
jgi:hypothetical protein